MRRGEVYWYDFGGRAKRRPVLILTGTASLPHLSTATVAAITSTIRGTKSEVVVTSNEGLPKTCAINLHQIHTVEQSGLQVCLSRLSATVMGQVDEALRFALSLSGFEGED